MNVYHGSYTKIEEIDFAKSAPNKDFGKGFYVTKFRKHAESWAKIIGKRHHTEGYVTEFLFYDTEFTERLCKVKHFDSYNEEWLDFVVDNRNPFGPKHDYDIVEGPVADDKIQRRLIKYLQGNIPKEVFLDELRYHEPTHQICFCTSKSLLTLNNEKKSHVDYFFNIEDIGEPLLEKLMLDRQIDEIKAADLFYNSNTFTRLADESTGFHLKPWQEIYEMLKQELKTHTP